MIILGIETSCDETASAILEYKNESFSVLSNIVSSQIKLHSKWGGVVPNLAAREHLKNILPVINESLTKAHLTHQDIDLISVTNGPGLIPALLIGVSTAKTLSYIWQKPLLGIHHIEGHIYANLIQKDKNEQTKFPILCLVVSGGHTQLILMKKHLHYEVIGETLDDAAGEAFDKVARILGLDYPGGPAVAKNALRHKSKNNPLKSEDFKRAFSLSLPRPMIKSKNLNFSFSGLKTAVLYKVKELQKTNPTILNEKNGLSDAICCEFQQAVIDVLISKTLTAVEKFRPKTIMLAGGVSANLELREQLGQALNESFKNISYKKPALEYSIDNATMIAISGFYQWKQNNSKLKFKKEIQNNWKYLKTNPNLKLK